jgi:hypothetical protein
MLEPLQKTGKEKALACTKTHIYLKINKKSLELKKP